MKDSESSEGKGHSKTPEKKQSHIWVFDQDKELAKKLYPDKSFKKTFHDLLSKGQEAEDQLAKLEAEHEKLQAKHDKLEARYEKLKKSKIVQKYDFHNDKYPNLNCSLCGEKTLGKQVFAQKYEDGSKSYFCPDCHYQGYDVSGDALYRLDKELRDRRKIINQAGKEKEALYVQIDALKAELDQLAKIDIPKAREIIAELCRDKKIDQSARWGLLRTLTDIRDYYEELAELKAKEIIKTAHNGGTPRSNPDPKKERVCPQCKQKFVPKRWNQKYCDWDCAKDGQDEKALDRRWDAVGNSMGDGYVRPVGYDPFRDPY